ncbi:MAG TPA: hypothetical protein VFF04_00665, partial [Candidatus Babeliales bacterium]|nr:hypothetical protein [Candidatus Babeliales bacterium]
KKGRLKLGEFRMKRTRLIFYAYALGIMPWVIAQSECPIDDANLCGAAPYFSIRSQGENAVREMVGWQKLINVCDKNDFYGAISLVGEYSESFDGNDISRVLFGNDFTHVNGCCGINITGSQVGNIPTSCPTIYIPLSQRAPNDWLADYFGLPVGWQSTICFAPKIRNFVADVELYLGLAQWAQGLYARLHMPITWTKWNLNVRENIIDLATNSFSNEDGNPILIDLGYPDGYFNFDFIFRTNLLDSALNFFNGTQAPVLTGVDREGNIIINTFDKLKYSKWDNCCGNGALSKTRLADLELVLGHNIVCNETGYFGVNVRAAAPTGNHPCGEFLFEPVVGNGGSWQLGGGIDAHAVLWEGRRYNSFSFYLDANITHLFKACQRRCFDLCGKPNSRYMLAERLGPNVQNLAGDTIGSDIECTDFSCTLSDAQFAGEFSPVANLTITKVNVSAAVQADVALKFTYDNGNGCSWDLGYNFFGRSCEKICRTRPTPLFDGKTWALKGDAFVYGFDVENNMTVPLAATESCATIHHGTNQVPFNPADFQSNAHIDNPEFAIIVGSIDAIVKDPWTQNQTKTSIQPVFLSEADVDLQGTSIISNKIFTHFNYSWLNRMRWTPFLGFGASVEVAHHKQHPVNEACCPSCRRTHANQGAIWFKGGAAWN